jgi:uncharacterized protein (TIGR03435 family)
MVRRLLAERFGLTFHKEKRELSAYTLTVAKGGAKMEKSTTPVEGSGDYRGRAMGNLTVRNGSMEGFARWLNGGILDRPVMNETGLEGRFNFTLNWTPDDSQYGGMGGRAASQADGANAQSLFTAIREQTGLQLNATKANVDVLVIDKLERPSDN